MQDTLYPLLAALAAYLIGSLSFAVIVSRLMGLSDPRSYGSGNPGATNVLRSGNKAAAVLTLVFDALKGALPVLAVQYWGAAYGLGEGTAALVGLAAFIGHLWPVFFRFVGGKGVATAVGVLLGLNPALAGLALLSWGVVLYFSRYVSLASIVAAALAPIYQMLFWETGPLAGCAALMALLLVWRHEGNIRKLLAGTESKLGQKASAPAAGTSRKHPHGVGPKAHGHSHQHHPKK
jgi:glycerol-3-phosphate acyltransferase PlsY